MFVMEVTMVPSQFLSVVLEEDNGSCSEEDRQSQLAVWKNQFPSGGNSSISDQEMRNLTKNLPKALLAECTVEISRTPVNQSSEKLRKPCFDARVSPIFNTRQSPAVSVSRDTSHQQYLPPPPQLLHRSEWIEESMDVQDLLTGVEAVYSDNESGGEYEETASVSIFPITVAKVKPEKVKKQDVNKFSYPCEHCPNVYSNRGALWQHSVATHSVEKTCECKICGRKFYRNCSLALHLKSHSEEEYCQCKECGKSFNRLANLERHMKVHAEAELFPCSNCERVFRDKANLLRHAVVHNHATKTFHCEICNKSFKNQENLDIHSQTHSDTSMTCSTCGDMFTSFAELMQHDATHSSDKVHLCKLCGLSFTDKNILKKHMMSHTGERLTCSMCGIDFTQKSSLLRHMKRMHPHDTDPSLLLEDKNSGRDVSSGNSSEQDVELEDKTENEQTSTTEIRKALGSPVKSHVSVVIEEIKNSEQSSVENHKKMLANCDTSMEFESPNNFPDVPRIHNTDNEQHTPVQADHSDQLEMMVVERRVEDSLKSVEAKQGFIHEIPLYSTEGKVVSELQKVPPPPYIPRLINTQLVSSKLICSWRGGGVSG